MRSHLALVLAVVLDVVTLGAVVLLLVAGVLPRELGAALLGALIGARGRWLSDGPPASPPATMGPASPVVAGRNDHHHLARDAFQGSAFGALLWPLFRWSRT